jgi:hypothetical protein
MLPKIDREIVCYSSYVLYLLHFIVGRTKNSRMEAKVLSQESPKLLAQYDLNSDPLKSGR